MATISNLNQIADAAGVSVTFVKALVGLSRPARTALRLQLNAVKQSLKGQLSTLAFKASVSKRKQQEIHKTFAAASAQLSQVKRVLNLLNFGPDFNDDPEVQRLVNTLLSAAKVKGVSLGGYRDADNVLAAIRFKEQQAAKATDYAEIGVKALNAQIDKIDNYLDTLVAIDRFSTH